MDETEREQNVNEIRGARRVCVSERTGVWVYCLRRANNNPLERLASAARAFQFDVVVSRLVMDRHLSRFGRRVWIAWPALACVSTRGSRTDASEREGESRRRVLLERAFGAFRPSEVCAATIGVAHNCSELESD